MNKKKLHFESSEGFRKYNAYRFIHNVDKGKKPYPDVYIGGEKHNVSHQGANKHRKGFMHLP